MARKLLSILAVFLSISAVSEAQIKVGYVNFQEVLTQLPERDSVAAEMNTFVNQKRQEYQQELSDFFEKETAYEDNKSSMSAEQRAAREEELNEMENNLTGVQSRIQSEIQRRQQQLLAPIYNRIDKAIAEVAEKNSFDFVLNEKTSVGEDIIYFSSDENQNITEQVLQQAIEIKNR